MVSLYGTGGGKGFPEDFSAPKLLFLFHGWSLVQEQGVIREIGAENSLFARSQLVTAA